jgi:PAS domain S-box-containing protein
MKQLAHELGMSHGDCAQLEQGLAAICVGVWEIDVVSSAMVFSPELESLCGLAPGVFGGTGRAAVQCVHPEDRGLINEIAADVARGRCGLRLEFRLLRPDGGIRWVESFGAVLRDELGHPRRVVGVATDITERKQKERELRVANEDLIYFSSAASHDLQEPLRGVLIYSQLLDKYFANQKSEEAAQYVRFILDGCNRLQMLLKDLRTYSEVSQAQEEGHPAGLLDCNIVLAEVRGNLRAAIAASGAIITQDPLPMVRGRRIHLIELFQNVIGNAIKYRGQEPPAIHISARWSTGGCIFSVRDNGIGIDPKDAKEIFGAFKRLGRDVPGTGMGLAICKRIVERDGGRIWVESEPACGSTFYFIFCGNVTEEMTVTHSA